MPSGNYDRRIECGYCHEKVCKQVFDTHLQVKHGTTRYFYLLDKYDIDEAPVCPICGNMCKIKGFEFLQTCGDITCRNRLVSLNSGKGSSSPHVQQSEDFTHNECIICNDKVDRTNDQMFEHLRDIHKLTTTEYLLWYIWKIPDRNMHTIHCWSCGKDMGEIGKNLSSHIHKYCSPSCQAEGKKLDLIQRKDYLTAPAILKRYNKADIDKCAIYFAFTNEWVKVGITNNIDRRMYEIHADDVLYKIADTARIVEIEQQIHSKLHTLTNSENEFYRRADYDLVKSVYDEFTKGL